MIMEPPSKAYLVCVETGESLELQFAPNDFTEEVATSWAAIKIPGASAPRRQWVSGEARKLPVKIDFYRLPDIRGRVRWIQSLQFPSYQNGHLVASPCRVMLVFGGLYDGVTWIVTATKVRWHDLFAADLTPLRAEVEIQLEEYRESSPDYREMRAQ